MKEPRETPSSRETVFPPTVMRRVVCVCVCPSAKAMNCELMQLPRCEHDKQTKKRQIE